MSNQRKARLSVDGVAADVLAGVEVVPGSDSEAALRKIAALTGRIRQIQNPPAPNPYQADFHAFLRDCCWTIDEARGGKVARYPAHWPFVADLVDAFMICPLLMIEKSRRVLASWTACAMDIWLAAGGQDPRWRSPSGEPVLLNSDSYRQVFVVARKYEDSCRFLHRRVKPIADFFEKYGGRELWPSFPRFDWMEGEGRVSNGSLITAVAQGADQLRGPGATFVHVEEFSFMEQAQRTLSGLIPTVAGGGHVAMLTTALANSYAKLVRDGALKAGWRGVRDEPVERPWDDYDEEGDE